MSRGVDGERGRQSSKSRRELQEDADYVLAAAPCSVSKKHAQTSLSARLKARLSDEEDRTEPNLTSHGFKLLSALDEKHSLASLGSAVHIMDIDKHGLGAALVHVLGQLLQHSVERVQGPV
eukprot:1154308-Pelagomonas_calceolata.AAC.7